MRTRRWRLLTMAVIVILALVALTACGPAEEAVDEPDDDPEEDVGPKTGGTLVIGYTEEPDILDPHRTVAIASNFVLSLMGDAVIERDLETGDFIPHLATDWEISEDGQSLTLFLRDDVTFHSGEPFNAHALKATWDRAMEPGNERGGGRLGPLEDIIAEDDYTLTMIFDQPFGPLMINLASPGYMQAMDPVHVERYGDDFGFNPASTGAWKLDEWVTGRSITLVRNEDYNWAPEFYDNQGPAYIDKIEIRYIIEDATRMAALETGEIDVAGVPSTDIDRFLDNPDFHIFEYMREGVCMSVWFNHDREPLDDVRVRQALAWGIDKQAIIDVAADGRATEAHGVLPPNMWGYWEGVEDISYSLNREKAAELLDEAGWVLPEGKTIREKDGEPLALELFIQPVDSWIRTSEMLQAGWRQIGVDIEIQTFEWGTLMEYLSEGRHDLNLMGYGSTDPDWLFRIFHSSQAGTGLNWTFVRDPEMDYVTEGQRYTVDPDERLHYAAEGQRLAIERAHWAPVFISDRYIAVNKRVQDFKINFRGTWYMHDVWLEP